MNETKTSATRVALVAVAAGLGVAFLLAGCWVPAVLWLNFSVLSATV